MNNRINLEDDENITIDDGLGCGDECENLDDHQGEPSSGGSISEDTLSSTVAPINVKGIFPESQNGNLNITENLCRPTISVIEFGSKLHPISMGSQSRRSQVGSSSQALQSSTSAEKAETTKHYLALVTTISYTIFLIVFGMISFAGSAISTNVFYAEFYMITLIVISLIYLIYLMVDIHRHVNKMKEIVKSREETLESFETNENIVNIDSQNMQCEINSITEDGPIELQEGSIELQNGSIVINNNNNVENAREASNSNENDLKNVPENRREYKHRYCFVRGRHGEFLYLKLGATWFCFGLIIHSSLILTYEIFYLTTDDEKISHCGSIVSLIFEILFPIFCVCTLMFMFKYINLIINVRRKLARFMFMHLIGTSIAFWLYQIVCETKEAAVLSDIKSAKDNVTLRLLFMRHDCTGPVALNEIYENFSPFLYPFIIEYCILSASVWYIIFSHINKCPKKTLRNIVKRSRRSSSVISIEYNLNDIQKFRSTNKSGSPSLGNIHDEFEEAIVEHETFVKNNIEVHIDCHRSNRGLFTGLIMIVLTIVFIILFFIATSETNDFRFGLMLDDSFKLTVLLIMIIAAVFSYQRVSTLDINKHDFGIRLDDVLLFIGIPAFFVQAIFTMIPAVLHGNTLKIFKDIVQLIQILIQTPFIVDGMRRCSNSRTLRRRKPGREFVTFLIFANVSLWLYYTFSVKTVDTGDFRYEYYGYTIWSTIYHLTLPLKMFYRFHSSVCLADIWKHSYEKENH